MPQMVDLDLYRDANLHDLETPLKRQVQFVGSVVMWATRMLSPRIRHDVSNVPCRGRLHRRLCHEYLIVGIEEDHIYWSCDTCGDWGRIYNWELSQWDRRGEPT